jgi:hypothetical protein
MWTQVEHDLSQLLAGKVFPRLRGLLAYEKLLKPNGQTDPLACRAAAHEIINSTDLKSGIREFGGREAPKAQEWSKPICRAISPKNNPYGFWWFDEALVERWAHKYPVGTAGRKENILDSIRPMLAVCFDFNDFTDLLVMHTVRRICQACVEARLVRNDDIYLHSARRENRVLTQAH